MSRENITAYGASLERPRELRVELQRDRGLPRIAKLRNEQVFYVQQESVSTSLSKGRVGHAEEDEPAVDLRHA